ncbi:MAG: ornithine carbamoyltransferase [Ferrimicrobium sp.]
MIVDDIDAFERTELIEILERSRLKPSQPSWKGRTVAGVFEHPSLRTRSALASALSDLGGLAVFFSDAEIGIDSRESAEDIAHLLVGHHDGIAARLRSHAVFTRMASVASEAEVDLVNLLTDYAHPTQALADALTLVEHLGSMELSSEVRVVYLGDANNVARSLAKVCLALGCEMVVATPVGVGFNEADRSSLEAYRRSVGGSGRLVETHDPLEAAAGATVLYTDVWVSMGQDAAVDAEIDFRPFAIDDRLVELARPDAIVMHCLPAHRGQEIAASVIDGAQSRVWEQAWNRKRAMRGLFDYLGERWR